MQINEASQFSRDFCVKWDRSCFVNAYSFIKRRPELRTRYNQRITYQRAKQEDPKVIKQWFETVREAIQEHSIHKDDIWNFDETGFAMGLCTTSK
ncbi:hypothetical protein GB937_010911, partial [Aspergillus fischeri]